MPSRTASARDGPELRQSTAAQQRRRGVVERFDLPVARRQRFSKERMLLTRISRIAIPVFFPVIRFEIVKADPPV
ncbi:protein of unknown function [Paraburkholderia dioscoreae]|uniref:Uncharacterized protein n=1 Tax=Paraburkholderia dioscoreae TaxID=2604047 RepID=A0A5Q4ZTE5_9BURK|nr:protein of unknown function [Paraburkholderia dioscoreae]